MDTHSPGWMVAVELPTGTMPPGVMEGAEEAGLPTVNVTGTIIAVDPLLNTTCPAYMPAESVVAFTLIKQAAGVAKKSLVQAELIYNQLPPPAVCVVTAKRKLAPVLTRVTVCASGLEPTGIVNCSGDT